MVRAAFAAHSGCRHRTPRNGRGTSVSVRELSRTDRAHLCENACASHPMSPISIFEITSEITILLRMTMIFWATMKTWTQHSCHQGPFRSPLLSQLRFALPRLQGGGSGVTWVTDRGRDAHC